MEKNFVDFVNFFVVLKDRKTKNLCPCVWSTLIHPVQILSVSFLPNIYSLLDCLQTWRKRIPKQGIVLGQYRSCVG
jgi:hypothetical protein